MDIFFAITLVWLLIGIWIASSLVKKTPWKMLIGSVILCMYGGAVAIASTKDGEIYGSASMYFSGQLLLLFFSVLGGALASTALSEMRNNHLEQK